MPLTSILVGGFQWVNLANTVYLRNGVQTDFINNEESLLEYLVASHLLSPDEKDSLTPELRSQIYRLRDLFRRMLTDITEKQLISETDLEKLNDIGKKISLEFHLVREVQDITSKITGKTKGDQIIFEILASFAETFEKAGMDRIRSCSHEECILFFVDVSKGGKRRWCSMESCGNRAKVSNFYSRKKG